MTSKKYVIFSDIISLILLLFVAYIIIFVAQVLENLKSNDSIPFLALFMSMIAFVFSTGLTTVSDIYKRHSDLKAEELREKEQELRYIKDSIDLFYIHLLNLLEKDNIDLITIINGHKYLAQPEIRSLFEEYLQTKKGKEELIELAYRDLEELQKQLMK